jgi:hypothetical protein
VRPIHCFQPHRLSSVSCAVLFVDMSVFRACFRVQYLTSSTSLASILSQLGGMVLVMAVGLFGLTTATLDVYKVPPPPPTPATSLSTRRIFVECRMEIELASLILICVSLGLISRRSRHPPDTHQRP